MPNPVVTPNMSLTEPGIGNTLSPTWAQNLNTNFLTIDQHNHAPGSGVQITPAGININQDLPFLDNNAVGLRSSRYQSQASPLSLGTDLNCTYVSGVDLYYNDGSGNQIRLTALGGIAGTPGSISNLVSPASASYVTADSTFVWQSSSGVAANMDAATYILRYPSTGYPTPTGTFIALQAPSTLATGYAMTFPVSLPSGNSFLQFNSSGALVQGPLITGGITSTNISASANILGTQLSPSANILGTQLSASANILGSQLSSTADILGNQIRGRTITGSNLVLGTVSGAEIASSVNLGGTPQVLGKDIVTNVANPFGANGLQIMRAQVSAAGTLVSGEGFTVSLAAGVYTVTFNTAFADIPIATITPINATLTTPNITVLSTTQLKYVMNTSSSAAASIIVVGQRL